MPFGLVTVTVVPGTSTIVLVTCTVRTLTRNFPGEPKMAISAKVFSLKGECFLIGVLSHLGPWARIGKAVWFKGFGVQGSCVY